MNNFNMNRIATFERVSFEQYVGSSIDYVGMQFRKRDDEYSAIKLPRRATKGSAGYDFFCPFGFMLKVGESILVPTGVRCRMDSGWVLKIYPRSGLGFKYRVQLDNTVGIIDQDYYNSDNEGHIMLKVTNDGNDGKLAEIGVGEAFAQGIFSEYGITTDDDVDGIRNGGFGSTTGR